MAPPSSPNARTLLDEVVRASDNAPWCDALSREAAQAMGSELSSAPAESLNNAQGKLKEWCDEKVDVGLVSMQVGQYAALGEGLAGMAALAVKFGFSKSRSNSAGDSLSERLKAYTATHAAAEELRAKVAEHTEHLTAMLKCAKAVDKTCADAVKSTRGLIKAAEALSVAGGKDKTTASPLEEQDESLKLLVRAGLHFIVVEDIVEATRVHRIMAGVKDKPKALRLHPRAGCFMVDGSLVIYVSPAGNAFFVLVKDRVRNVDRLGADLVKAGLPRNWLFESSMDSRLSQTAAVQALPFDRVGYYKDRKRVKRARVEKADDDGEDSEEENEDENDEPDPEDDA